jgi:hypothetical protein
MMSRLRRMSLAGVGAVVLVASVQAQSTPQGKSERPEALAGIWMYNALQSVNAATGRPERVPRGATQRAGGIVPAVPPPPATTAPPPSAMGPITGASAGTVPQGAFGFARPGDVGPTVAMIQENRALTRDLLEISETLSISVEPEAITFTDDLQRARTYPTTGERRKYQLGAARFNAAAFWNETRLEKKIDAADGFRMTETYFLDETASKLFVLLRVGSSRKGAPVMGVNRVYDRAEP